MIDLIRSFKKTTHIMNKAAHQKITSVPLEKICRILTQKEAPPFDGAQLETGSSLLTLMILETETYPELKPYAAELRAKNIYSIAIMIHQSNHIAIASLRDHGAIHFENISFIERFYDGTYPLVELIKDITDEYQEVGEDLFTPCLAVLFSNRLQLSRLANLPTNKQKIIIRDSLDDLFDK